jgi:hypothetical protein
VGVPHVIITQAVGGFSRAAILTRREFCGGGVGSLYSRLVALASSVFVALTNVSLHFHTLLEMFTSQLEVTAPK